MIVPAIVMVTAPLLEWKSKSYIDTIKRGIGELLWWNLVQLIRYRLFRRRRDRRSAEFIQVKLKQTGGRQLGNLPQGIYWIIIHTVASNPIQFHKFPRAIWRRCCWIAARLPVLPPTSVSDIESEWWWDNFWSVLLFVIWLISKFCFSSYEEKRAAVSSTDFNRRSERRMRECAIPC